MAFQKIYSSKVKRNRRSCIKHGEFAVDEKPKVGKKSLKKKLEINHSYKHIYKPMKKRRHSPSALDVPSQKKINMKMKKNREIKNFFERIEI